MVKKDTLDNINKKEPVMQSNIEALGILEEK